MPKFALRFPFFILMLCLLVSLVGVVTIVRMPVDLFPEIDMPVVVVATFYNGMPPQQIEADITNTFERFFTLGGQCRSQRVALAHRREPDQDLLQAGDRSQRGTEQHRQPGDGRSAPPAAGNAAAGGAGHDRLDAAGVPGDAEGPGAERDQSEGPGAVPGAQPDFERAGRIGSATLRRNVPADPDLRRSAEAGGAQPEPERRGEVGEQLEPDSARRRRAHRLQGLTTSTPTASFPTRIR